MSFGSWLRLTDYASKHHVSISTLRRRIKNGDLSFRFEDGKYLIFEGTQTGDESRPAAGIANKEPISTVIPVPLNLNSASGEADFVVEAQQKLDRLRSDSERSAPRAAVEEPILSSANKLLTELKKAYTSILQEKEEQMIQLKEEVSDLKTLVRVLEDDNDRLRRSLQIENQY